MQYVKNKIMTHYECDNCYEPLSHAELEDPIIINHFIYCDRCTPEVIAYRHKMRKVGEMTKAIKHSNYYKLLK